MVGQDASNDWPSASGSQRDCVAGPLLAGMLMCILAYVVSMWDHNTASCDRICHSCKVGSVLALQDYAFAGRITAHCSALVRYQCMIMQIGLQIRGLAVHVMMFTGKLLLKLVMLKQYLQKEPLEEDPAA